MDRKNSMLAWRTRDIVIFILSIIGLALLLVYGSKAVADANDRRYVEGWRNSPAGSTPATDIYSSYTPAALASVTPKEKVPSQIEATESESSQKAADSMSSQSAEGPGNRAGLLKRVLPQVTKRLN